MVKSYMSSSNDDHHDDDPNDEEYIHNRCEQYGDLYIQYKVNMPAAFTKKNGIEEHLTAEERDQLGELLDKLETGTISDSAIKNKAKKKANNKDESAASRYRYLSKALASDFGRASGSITDEKSNDEHFHADNDEDTYGQDGFQHSFFGSSNPFGASGSRTFFSRRSEYSTHDENDGDVQCQQM